jgi:lysophospholipase L1-like esterase
MIKYAAVGDSLTVGVGGGFSGGFVPRYSNLTQQKLNRPVVFENMGVSGATTGDVLTMVTREPEVRRVLQAAGIVTVTAGGNDLVEAAKSFLANGDKDAFMKALARCRQNFGGIITEIRRMKSGRQPYIIRAVDLYNPFPSIPEANQWVQRFNQHLESFEDGHLKVANIFRLFEGRQSELISSDRFHPNSRGYVLIADELYKQGYKPLL